MEWHEIQKQMKTCGVDLFHHSMELEIDEEEDLKTLQFIVTYFAPRRQHTVEVLTQNGLYCTFQHSPQFLFAHLQKKDSYCENIFGIFVCHLGGAIRLDWFSKKT